LLVARVKPNSKVPGIEVDGNGVTIRVGASPADGDANEAARHRLAEALGLPPSAVQLVRGMKTRTKTFVIAGMERSQIHARLLDEGRSN